MYICKRVCRDIFCNLSYCKVSCACSRTRSARILRLLVEGEGVFPVRDIILRHYHHRHHHRDGSHLDILWLSLTHYPTYAHWRHSVSQSVCHCWSLRFLWLHAGFPSRRSFLNSARLERVSCGVLLVFTQREIPFRCIEVFSVYNLKYPWVY